MGGSQIGLKEYLIYRLSLQHLYTQRSNNEHFKILWSLHFLLLSVNFRINQYYLKIVLQAFLPSQHLEQFAYEVTPYRQTFVLP